MELGATNVVALLSPGVYLFVGFERKTETEEDLHTRRRKEKKRSRKEMRKYERKKRRQVKERQIRKKE